MGNLWDPIMIHGGFLTKIFFLCQNPQCLMLLVDKTHIKCRLPAGTIVYILIYTDYHTSLGSLTSVSLYLVFKYG